MRSRRNTFACNLVNHSGYDIADEIRELSLKGTALKWVGVKLGVRTSIG
jgi:methionine synthase I (cobalamin-dependent)